MTFISRDPFARTEIHRECTRDHVDGCDNCGQFVRMNKPVNPRVPDSERLGSLYSYTVEHDAGRREPIKGRFCSIGCMREYHILGGVK